MFRERYFLLVQEVTIILSVNAMDSTSLHLQNRAHLPWALTTRKVKTNPHHENGESLWLQMTTPITNPRLSSARLVEILLVQRQIAPIRLLRREQILHQLHGSTIKLKRNDVWRLPTSRTVKKYGLVTLATIS
jgi:hypothetical protein